MSKLDPTALSARKQLLLARRLTGVSPDASSTSMIGLERPTGPLPLSSSQRRLWFLDQLQPGSSAYNNAVALKLGPRVHMQALSWSINEIIRRHEALRTRIVCIAGQPYQEVLEDVRIDVPLIALNGRGDADESRSVSDIARREAEMPFDLSTGPLIRAGVVRGVDGEHGLLLCMHHIVSDGWSLSIVLKELSVLYPHAARGAGVSPSLPSIRLQFPDFALWQDRWLSSDEPQRQLRYWLKKLANVPVLTLPTDRPRPAQLTLRGARLAVRFDADLTARVRRFCVQQGVTPFMTLLSAFAALLARYSGSSDIVVGTPTAGRNRIEWEPVIGLFVNTLVLRLDLAEDPPFHQLLRRVRETTLEAYDQQELPFDVLVDKLRPQRDLGRNPLFQVSFQLLEGVQRERSRDEAEFVDFERVSSAFDLTLDLWEQGHGIEGRFEFNTDLFFPETIRRMSAHLRNLLESGLADPETPLSRLQLLDRAEERTLLELSSPSATQYDDCGAHALFERRAAEAPNSVALEHQGRTLSYAELNEQANRLAHELLARGVRTGDRVALCLPRGPMMVAALLAVWKSGGAWVPLEPAHPSERRRYQLDDSGGCFVLTQVGAWPDADERAIFLDACAHELALRPRHNPEVACTPHQLAYVMYTSGSTGVPKGVMVEHRGLVNYLCWGEREYRVGPGSMTPVHSSLTFDLTVTSLILPLACGGAVELLAETSGVESLARALSSDREYALLKITPSHLRLLALQLASGGVKAICRLFVVGGEPLPPELADWWLSEVPGLRMVNEYGPTETVVGCCIYEVSRTRERCSSLPIGRPIANTRLYVLDQHGRVVPRGVAGELCIAGDGVARGYWNLDELTHRHFVPDPFEPCARMYRSGDRARHLADGNLEFLGRADEQVKVRGFRAELGEIEAVLREIPGIREAAVIVIADALDQRLAAYLAPIDGSPDDRAVRAALLRLLPDAMIPSSFERLEHLPITENGKLDRGRLPDPVRRAPEKTRVAPRSELEADLAGIFRDVLSLADVGVEDDFFRELGGHSLLAAQVVARIRDRLGIEIPLRQIFETSTVAGLSVAVIVEGASRVDADELRRLLEEVQHDGASDGASRDDGDGVRSL